MKEYYRVMLGSGSKYANNAFDGNFIGASFGLKGDLQNILTDDMQLFNERMIPQFLETHPGKSKIAAGLACASLWKVCRGIHIGDVVLSPDGSKNYRVADVIGEYFYVPGEQLPHRRPVEWRPRPIPRDDMSDGLQHSTGSLGAVSTISKHVEEIESLLGSMGRPTIISTDETVEDPK